MSGTKGYDWPRPWIIFRLVKFWVIPLLGATVALGLIFLLYRGLNLDLFLIEFKKTDPWWIAALGVAILVEQLLHGWKWRQLLFDVKPVSSWRLTGALLAGYGANILVPLGISPMVRSWLVARLEGLHMATVLITTGISRFIDGVIFALLATAVALAGQIPNIEGNLRVGLAVAGALNFILFSGILCLLYAGRLPLTRDGSLISRPIDWLASKGHGRLDSLRVAIANGIIWPQQLSRQVGVIAASVAMKAVSATHFLWAGLAVGVTLGILDYLFVMVFAGFALVLTRFIRVPGGFVIGAGFALKLLGVPNEQALVMILFSHMISIILVVGIGLMVLWQSGIEIRNITQNIENVDNVE